ncbi:sensor histidine kinase inhibitor, KipI family [Pseudonocardia thermophila]|uniref:Sensor histidine kinase inhibitor, KipI family n=1 Tax=Pseudonocardia thermophila TaxID=1848 RepID=A0A1M7A5E6_PSETH|nr:sensor histidine kinase inhibitor, KipI family [Pseudonocardia thermophila]
MDVRPCADAGLLFELATLDEVLALAAAVRNADLDGVVDVVPAARSLLLRTVPGTDLRGLRKLVLDLPLDVAATRRAGGTVEIPVVYDGPDLGEVARQTGLTPEEVVAAHTGSEWTVGFGGFAPGFAYLAGGDPRLTVARRPIARTRVPAGSVGLAGEFSGIYPRESPGGWQLIGRTDVVLWDADRDPPALLQPGSRVRFVQVERLSGEPRPPARRAPVIDGPRVLEVLATGAQALVQDLGRPGHAATGVGASGAADRCALRLANRLVANPEDAAAIEVTFGGLAVRAGSDLRAPLLVALTGAPAPATVDGKPVGHNALVRLGPGQTLRLGTPPTGLRTYLAVRGGIDVPPLLGSRATDVLAGFGPTPLQPGTVLPIGPEPDAHPLLDVAPVAPPPADTVTLRAVLGPRADWVHDPASLHGSTWTVSDRSDRVGMRLIGGGLTRCRDEELPSEGMVRGAIQVPPGGEPVLFLADHPVTGGYPVVAVVLDADVDRAAQVRPGQRIRFRLVDEP